MPSIEFDRWFSVDGLDARWLNGSPAGRKARCDRSWQHLVEPDEPRLQINDGKGPKRSRGHGNRASFVCWSCASAEFGLKPPPRIDQQELW